MSGGAPAVPVLYEDNHIIVVVKPPNVPTQEDESRDLDLLTLIKADLKHRHGKPGNVYLGLVHRLDRPVGGVMVFAKTSKAASRLSDAVRTRAIRKQYQAVVYGKPTAATGTLRHHLLKDTRTNMVAVVPADRTGAKEAILDYRVLSAQEGMSLVEIELHTGRPHQIRVQFAAIGCPLVGDQRYGGSRAVPGQQIALWSTSLSFEHPVGKEQLRFQSRPPAAYPWLLWGTAIT
ncbi:23S rRNA pseudouridine1911/1915/1917 synthase [Paenibacillus sp. UNCCL117]|uniref:RluA family pseudouridine synthase n=1 Tax=unclassified Paenibacillus TaxID=185978 RepID=UPI0008813FAB|nr:MULTISPECIES: RNA pseudouridine synthase [unclassified Paenibacillus]SDC42792.1 23S rRNA pseudouridine1911/1915/1917 synthase [Paenibacillus sp. cl123]SFW13144.1 23S rRNA pseudouridine1911/1915/1917 synthase [Paenibacillus sp. UNCCL117]